ncbi:MAG: polysaccharide biosynthesis tyrosine autokinase [Thiohalocapsa sp.]|jgi:receptor protein-tyrosine kinase|nr:polysaccharide biosynthesis tyrosine autokinase [Thiohalocapsa sp.]MCF7990323.1 polysaccharide biosynthesis tyrosine autokinase [Thiohalocapsa sp.]
MSGRERAASIYPEEDSGAESESGNWLSVAPQRTQAPAEVRKRFAHRRLGDILVALGALSEEQRDKVVQRQAKKPMLFGQLCVKMKLVSEDELAEALALQFGYLHPVAGSLSVGKELVMVSDPFGVYAEALRTVSNRLATQWIKPGRNVMAITGAERGEGRSYLAANLAICFSQSGMRTLLVDADMRQPRQHRIFSLPQHPGFSRLLCGFAPEEVVKRVPELSYLSLITSGPVPPNPLEILGRPEVGMFMHQAGEYYDVVIVDTPASTRHSDAELIASAAGNALMVVRKNKTRERRVRKLRKTLEKRGAEVIGTLMNTH